MEVSIRIQTCLLLEKMHKQKEYSQRLGVKDRSTYRGKEIKGETYGT